MHELSWYEGAGMRHSFLRGVTAERCYPVNRMLSVPYQSFDSPALSNMSPPLCKALHPLPAVMHLEMRKFPTSSVSLNHPDPPVALLDTVVAAVAEMHLNP
jgi:hypothetical protein